MDITKLDPQSRWEMRLIEVETAIEKLNKKPSDPKIGESEARIKVLEDARQRQIAFNSTVQIKGVVEVKPSPTNTTGKKSVWKLWN